MNCDQVRSSVVETGPRPAPPPLIEHLDGCAACARFASQHSRLLASIRAYSTPAVSTDPIAALLSRLDRASTGDPAPSSPERSSSAFRAAVGAAKSGVGSGGNGASWCAVVAHRGLRRAWWSMVGALLAAHAILSLPSVPRAIRELMLDGEERVARGGFVQGRVGGEAARRRALYPHPSTEVELAADLQLDRLVEQPLRRRDSSEVDAYRTGRPERALEEATAPEKESS